MWKSICILAFCCLTAAALLAPASASDTPYPATTPDPGARQTAIEKQIINPCQNCGGQPLNGSFCGEAIQSKDKIRSYVEAGMSDDQILAQFAGEYGEWVLTTPREKGFGWLLPVVGVVLGGGGLVMFLRRSRGSHAVTTASSEAVATRVSTNTLAETILSRKSGTSPEDEKREHYRKILAAELARL